ncbi:MAG: hypothetical protein JXQ27_06765 [Acidobacteria bacterium]|nr:hypothetical protein [Acidobacteriota bacterium]
MSDKEYIKPMLDYMELTPSLSDKTRSPLTQALREWLDQLTRDKKTEYLFELEMWINCLERFFRISNHPLSDYERSELLSKDFSEELKIVHSVTVRMSHLATEILTREKQHLIQFERYIENELNQDIVLDAFLEKLIEQPSPEDSLTLLLDSLTDTRNIISAINQNAHVPYQTFTSVGKLVNREIKRCKYIDLLITYKFKPHYDKIHNKRLAAIVKSIKNDHLRQHVAKVFLELFRILNYMKFVEVDLNFDRPLKNTLMLFILIRSDLHMLMNYMEGKIIENPHLPSDLGESIEAILYALRMELKKVFNHELVGMVYMRQAQLIFAKVENSHGLLRNCLQNAIVQIAQVFDPEFDGTDIFQNLSTRLKESLKLREDLKNLSQFIKEYQADTGEAEITNLIERLASFRDLSLKYLMYRDWDDFEKFTEEIIISSGRSELNDVLHRFQVFLEALLGEINKRAVLQNYLLEGDDTGPTELWM